jgi:sterol desaturase/sphingolipid hydroxylase (fatty acid hydroxylase superfamily)
MLNLMIAVLLVALLTAVELRWPARLERAPRMQNLGLWAVRALLQFTAAATFLTLAAVAVERLGAPSLKIRAWPLALSAPLLILTFDLAEYLYHRTQHTIPWLWRRHALHHSDPCVNATTTERHWWGDLMLKAVLFNAPLAVLLEPSAADYAIYSALTFWNYVVHANVKLDFGRFGWVLNSPAYHRLHHARAPEHHGANYAALFPIFDVIAGSYRRPETWLETGLDEEPRGLWEALAWPPREQAQRVAVSPS